MTEPAPYAEGAFVYTSAGWENPIPVRGKAFPVSGYTGASGATVSMPDVYAWTEQKQRTWNLALRMSKTMVAIDIDAHDGKDGANTFARAEAALGKLPKTWFSTSRGGNQPSRIMVFVVEHETSFVGAEKRVRAMFGEHVDVLHFGHRYMVTWPSIHPDTDQPYLWYTPDGLPSLRVPNVTELATLPADWLTFLTTGQEAPGKSLAVDTGSKYTRPVGVGERSNVSRDFTWKLAHTGVEYAVARLAAWGWWAKYVEQPDGNHFAFSEVETALRNAYDKVDTDDLGLNASEEGDDARGPLGQVYARSKLENLPTIDLLIEGILSRPSAAVMVGGTSIGKTFVALSMAGSVATGKPWLGRPVEQGHVIYVGGEGAYGLHKRLSAWEQAWGAPIADDQMTVCVKPHSLIDKLFWRELYVLAQEVEAKLIILDTFSSLAPDADETKDAAVILRRLSDLATLIGGTALLVHHPGWSDSGRARGGYQIEANADEVIVLSGFKNSDLVEMKMKKVKEGHAGESLFLRRRAFGESVVIEMARESDTEIPIRQQILAILNSVNETGATGAQIMTEIGLPEEKRSTFYRLMSKVVEDGFVRREGTSRNSRYFITIDGAAEVFTS